MLREAVEEATEAAEWYAKERFSLANEFVGEFQKTLEAVQESPWRFSKLETLRTSREIRRAQLNRFPYLVIYEIIRDEPLVLAISHTSRSPDYWLSRG
jgi:hypothetical protein